MPSANLVTLWPLTNYPVLRVGLAPESPLQIANRATQIPTKTPVLLNLDAPRAIQDFT